ncbi:hypothetical protein BJV74DRAFT_889671 [Russula compacta]|nr:hypothetical protein BJV74DRAFT_889671 [Russula compacta]
MTLLPQLFQPVEDLYGRANKWRDRLLHARKSTPSIRGNINKHCVPLYTREFVRSGGALRRSFRVLGDDRLTILDNVRHRLPTAEIAFLSACHTAELTDESAADEALHLTAAMQYSGF